jgi:hypothetical protein
MVPEALKKDRELVNNRPMFVSKCEPDKQSRESGLRFPTKLEKNKLFVKGKNFFVDIYVKSFLFIIQNVIAYQIFIQV